MLSEDHVDQRSLNASMMALHEEQAHKLRSLEARLAEVEERVKLASTHPTDSPKRRAYTIQLEEEEEATSDDEPGNVYSLTVSMWDAAMLLGFNRVPLMDKLPIVAGVLINYALQVLLLLVVSLDMLDNHFTERRVEEVMKWRVDKGHAHAEVDWSNGSTLLDRLCNRSMWSFEQDQYSEMYEYLYDPMPGWSLTVLALSLWALAIAVEFRGVLEQGMAIFRLPRLDVSKSGLVKAEDGFQVVGMRRSRKWLVASFLILPRLAITIALAVVGCRYLAVTLSLDDILLNSLALAFVIDVDELVAEVLLTKKLKATVENVLPIESGKPCKIGACHVQDLIRYAAVLGLIIFAVVHWLVPFQGNVTAAAMALCAGNTGFSQTGSKLNLSTVVLLETQPFISTCSDNYFDTTYLPKHYAGFNQSSETKPLSGRSYAQTSTQVLERRRFKATLQYALSDSGCPSGEVKDVKYGECKKSEYLQRSVRSLTGLETVGKSALPPCKLFDPELGAVACNLTDQEACTWSWEGYQCEKGDPPGVLQRTACPSSFTGWDALKESCQIWENLFGKLHPLANCEILSYCLESTTTDCLNLVGHLALTIGDASSYGTNKSNTQAVISSSLSSTFGVPNNSVTILQIRGWSVNDAAVKNIMSNAYLGRRLTEASSLDPFWHGTELLVDNVSLVKFLVSSLPATLLPPSMPAQNVTLAAKIEAELGKGTVTSVELTPWPPWFGNSYQLRDALSAIYVEEGNQGGEEGIGNGEEGNGEG